MITHQQMLDAEVRQYFRDRRERIATAALTGLLANHHQDTFPPDTARIAVKYADALIAELDKEGAP